ncbi:MAG: HAD-IB family hydrolase [Gammaproteobacteria bacterium]|nr:HAD-IB family hydrolase [Gammaproteobacteria bacterium]
MAESTLAVFDLDGTITRHDTLWPFIAGFLLRHPRRWWRLPLCTAPLLRYLVDGRDRGALKGAVIRLTLGGLTRAQLDVWSERFTQRLLRSGLYGEALTCIAAHRRAQAHLVLLSASPDLYVPKIAAALGFDECVCSEVRWRPDGTLDGGLATPNRRGAEKTRCLRRLLAAHQPLLAHAYGNSRADLEHLRLVSAGTYVNGRRRDVLELPSVRAVRWSQRGDAGTLAARTSL